MRITGALLAVLLLLGGCGGGEPAADPTTTETEPSATATPDLAQSPGHVESDECRRDAQKVLDILGLAMADTDVRDVAGRLATIEKLMPEAVSLCSSAVSRSTSEAIDSVSDAVDAATSGGHVAKYLRQAARQIASAQQALDAEA